MNQELLQGERIPLDEGNELLKGLLEVYKEAIDGDNTSIKKPGKLKPILDASPESPMKKYYLSTGNVFVFNLSLFESFFLNGGYPKADKLIIAKGTQADGEPAIIVGVGKVKEQDGKKIRLSIAQKAGEKPLVEHTPLRATYRLERKTVKFIDDTWGDELIIEIEE